MPFAAPNGTVVTLSQCIMAIKSIVNLSSPLFLDVDTTKEGEVIVTYDNSLKNEREVILSPFAVYLEVISGSVVWNAFTAAYKLSMVKFQYCPLKKYTIERTTEIDASITSSIATVQTTLLTKQIKKI